MEPSGPRRASPVPKTDSAVVLETQLKFMPRLNTTNE
jgi:hypothetical protein